MSVVWRHHAQIGVQMPIAITTCYSPPLPPITIHLEGEHIFGKQWRVYFILYLCTQNIHNTLVFAMRKKKPLKAQLTYLLPHIAFVYTPYQQTRNVAICSKVAFAVGLASREPQVRTPLPWNITYQKLLTSRHSLRTLLVWAQTWCWPHRHSSFDIPEHKLLGHVVLDRHT